MFYFFNIIRNLHQPFMAEKPPAAHRNENRDDECEDETPGFLLHAVDEVHAKEWGNERGEHHDNGYRRQRTHDLIHIIVDNRLVGVHRRLQDVAVNIGSLASLRHLNVHILNQVCIQLVNLQFKLQLWQKRLIATDGSLEIGQWVL